MTQWIKTDANRWTASINGRTYTLLRNRKTRSSRVHTSWVSVGRKPRSSTTTTWYNVFVRLGDDVRQLEGFASTMRKAKAAAVTHSTMSIDAELARFASEFGTADVRGKPLIEIL
jgi:hypothetical protein